MIPEKAITAGSCNDLTSFEITDEIDPFLTSVIIYLKAMYFDPIFCTIEALNIFFRWTTNSAKSNACLTTVNFVCNGDARNINFSGWFSIFFFIIFETSYLYCERFKLTIVNRKSKFGSFNNNIDLKYLCSNWISINQFLQEWLVPAIRYELNFMQDNLKYSLIVRSSKLWCAILGTKRYPKV